MDPAVGLVQAYLRMNGFFTVTEYPVVRKTRTGSQVLTDLDILAVRFPSGGRWIQHSSGEWRTFATDSLLPDSDDHLVMILGEVKEGKAVFNRNAFDPHVLESALRRYGCCLANAHETALVLSRKGCIKAPLSHGSQCDIHTMLFGGTDLPKHAKTHYVSLRHAAEFMARTIKDHPDVFAAAQPKDTVLDLISVLVKTGATFSRAERTSNRSATSLGAPQGPATTSPRRDSRRNQ